MIRFPRIADNLEINQVEDGYVIYQADQDRVHYLNKSAVVVLESCTGENTLDEIEQILQEVFDLAEVPRKEVVQCLDSLYKEGLIK